MKRATEIPAGLCRSCRYARVIRSDRGSTFYKCQRSITEPDFPAYPTLPVLRCAGFERNPVAADSFSVATSVGTKP